MPELLDNEKDGLHRIAALAAKEITPMPGLDIKPHKLAKGMAGANLSLQLSELRCEDLFARAVLDPNTGAPFEYRDLIKNPDLHKQWTTS